MDEYQRVAAAFAARIEERLRELQPQDRGKFLLALARALVRAALDHDILEGHGERGRDVDPATRRAWVRLYIGAVRQTRRGTVVHRASRRY
jgi:hypothetical protein